MPLLDLFSRRKRLAETAEKVDVYQYNQLPRKLRVQLTHIWDESFGFKSSANDSGNNLIKWIVSQFRKELGVYGLTEDAEYIGYREEFYNWFLNEKDIDRCLDAVEICCRLIDRAVRAQLYRYKPYIKSEPDHALEEINARFLEEGIGYQYEPKAGELLRIDSQFTHSEVVKPLLSLLSGPDFASANGEFVEAHRLYRHRDYEKSLIECCKAFESTLKVIAAKRAWPVPANATAKTLIDVTFNNGLVPEYLQGEFTALRALLESGVPTIRNKTGGHGAGTTVRVVSPHLAAFQLHQTAAAMLFLIESHSTVP